MTKLPIKWVIAIVAIVALSMLSITCAMSQDRRADESVYASTQILTAIPVGTKYYAVDVDGFALEFVDRLGKIDISGDIKNDVFLREGKVDYDPNITILWDEALTIYRTAENLMEFRLAVDGEKVVQVTKSKVIELKMSKIE